MSHLSDDELVLHYYGEDGPGMAAARHLEACADCARAYDALTRTLGAVTPPDFVEAPDDTVALRALLLTHQRPSASRHPSTLARGALSYVEGQPVWLTAPTAVALVWLVPVLYPWSLTALFASAQASEQLTGVARLVLAVLWACAGPLIAIFALQGIPNGVSRVTTRLRVLGAVMATISSPLFLLVVRSGNRMGAWYAAIALVALLALIPWPSLSAPARPLRALHRLSAAILGIFILGHIVNQSLAFVSVESYAAMRSVMRVASHQSISYTVIVTAVALQIVTGAGMGLKHVGTGVFSRNVQAVSGWYLAVFLLSHVFTGFLFSRPAAIAAVAPVASSLTPQNLLVNATAVGSLPFYLLGVSAFLVHVGLYARIAALAWLPESSVRRLSYAGACVGAMVVVTVGLSLCGIHL